MLANGEWWLTSKSDPRWDAHGRGLVGGLCVPTDALAKLAELERELGSKPPSDMQYEYWKD